MFLCGWFRHSRLRVETDRLFTLRTILTTVTFWESRFHRSVLQCLDCQIYEGHDRSSSLQKGESFAQQRFKSSLGQIRIVLDELLLKVVNTRKSMQEGPQNSYQDMMFGRRKQSIGNKRSLPKIDGILTLPPLMLGRYSYFNARIQPLANGLECLITAWNASLGLNSARTKFLDMLL